GEILFQHQRLVIPAHFAAVASAQQRDLQPKLAIEASDILNARRLAGPTDGQVADTDDGDGGLVDRLPAVVERFVADGHAEPIAETQGPEAGTLKHRPGPAALAADQCVVNIVQSAIAQ